MLGIITGSGLYGLGKKYLEEDVITPYGDALIHKYKIGQQEIIFIPRHGKTHALPPHKINYKANVYAMNKLGVTAAFATYAAGIIKKYKPGDLIILEDFIGIDQPLTFFDDFSSGIKHVDFTAPFDKNLISKVKEAAAIHRIKLKEGGIIKTTSGPRFETKAEINLYKKMGANLVNMTSSYEITLMKEMEIPFAALSVGTNYACGISGEHRNVHNCQRRSASLTSKKPLTHEEVINMMKKKNDMIELIIKELANFVES